MVCLGLEPVIGYIRGAKISHKSRTSVKTLGAVSKFHTADLQILGASVQNYWPGLPGAQDLCTPGLLYLQKATNSAVAHP
jgi:hypothetical protein